MYKSWHVYLWDLQADAVAYWSVIGVSSLCMQIRGCKFQQPLSRQNCCDNGGQTDLAL